MKRLKGIIYDGIGWLAAMGFRNGNRKPRLLVLRVDEIGDFMLWHKFLPELLQAFPGHEHHFCGNQSWRTLFETFHGGEIAHSFWLDKIRFKKDMRYRYRFLRQVHKAGYTTVINPAFSRDKRYDDSIVNAAKAKETWGMVANQESVQVYERGYDKGLYIRLFDYPERPMFEFFRNRLFTEFVTGKKSGVTDTRLGTIALPAIAVPLPRDFFVVFPGSRSSKRIWPSENFAQVAHYLHENYGWTAVVCGTNSDKPYTDAFTQHYRYPVIDLTGQTSLPQMLPVFAKARCLLSVDTGSVHLAAAMNCPVFGVFNGSQYKRFAPYPASLHAHVHAIYPDEIEKDLQDEKTVQERYEFVVDIPYSMVRPEKMILAIHEHFSDNS
ncbi:MAG: glycosyltransferase family 9 protein [Chitinophagaceae bacterium]|nr:glycosyltransferase family 9 protein [Chitinophagaceae bacterium]